MEEFAGYGFNKSYLLCVRLLAYQTAYMKTHYPVESLPRCLRQKPAMPKAVKYINEARGMSI
jgi:DNA polymerase-3 subunit alpha